MARALGNGPLAAPALLPFQVASICLKKMASHPGQSGAILDAFRLFQRLSIEIVELDHPSTVVLARKMGLTTYDASYLWLTRELGAELVSLDEKLLEAAGRIVPGR